MSSNYSEDVEMRDIEEEEEEGEVDAELDADAGQSSIIIVIPVFKLTCTFVEASDSEGEEVDDDDEDLPPALANGERNSQLTVGYKGDRSYVVRGNNIGVFSQDSDRQVKYYATMSNISTPKGKEFKPKQVIESSEHG